jgi:SagB-type dehydrogenase family enzyme
VSADRLTVSPLLFAHRGRDGRLVAAEAPGGSRFRLGSPRAAELATSFLEPRSIEDALADGYSAEELRQAEEVGLLVSEDTARSHGAWERSGWSRGAALLLGQMDLTYVESEDGDTDADALRETRRRTVDEYRARDEQPAERILATGEAVELPPPAGVELTLDSMVARRSVRGFSRTPPTAAELAGVLHAATASMRLAEEDRSAGDPSRVLNSFFSWAHVFVVVQEVDGLPAGAFEYDWADHRLVRSISGPVAAADVLAAIQGQRGIGGTGFVVYLVADLRRYAWLYRHSRSYVHLLIQVGELAQELLMAAGALGLGGWPSPAVHESRCAALLGLPDDDGIEPLAIVKLGRPSR